MLDAVGDIKIGYVLCGIIWALACGFAVGNYACSLVHRLPRGKLMLDKTPYCGQCGTLLQTRDLFPVFSALMLRHRCRYCHEPFPLSHTWTELLVGLLFVLAFLQYNYGQEFILIACIGVFLITLAAIQTNENMLMGRILLCVLVFGMLYRVLVDGNIYGFVQGGLNSFLLGALLWRKQIKKLGHIYVLPPNAQLLAVGGVCVGIKLLPAFFALLLALCAFFALWSRVRHKPFIMSVPFGWAVILLVLYPHLLPPP